MNVVGLDLALVKTGWAVHGGPAGLIRTDLAATKHLKGIARRRWIADEVEHLVWRSAPANPAVPSWPPPDRVTSDVLVVIENHVASAATRGTAISLGQMHAVVLDTLAAQRCPIAYVTPASLKKFLAGSGKADKDAMVAAAQALGYQGHQEDEADAFGLALFGSHLLGSKDHLTPLRESCLKAVDFVVPLPEKVGVG